MEEEKVIIGNNKLTKEEVKANEDFSQLLKKHQLFVKKRNWKIGGLVAAGVFLIVALVLFFTSKIKTKNETKQNTVLVEKEKGITKKYMATTLHKLHQSNPEDVLNAEIHIVNGNVQYIIIFHNG